MSTSMIEQVHALALQEGVPLGLKIESQIGVILCDSAWTAGVDFEDDFDDNSMDDSEQNDSRRYVTIRNNINFAYSCEPVCLNLNFPAREPACINLCLPVT